MVFNSYIFLFLFLPVCVVGYYQIGRWKSLFISQWFLIAMSCLFYTYANVSFLPILIFSVVFNYLIYILFNKIQNSLYRKIILALAISVNVSLLLYFKYYNFFISNINVIFKTDYNLKNIILPLGISFYTFRLISFCIDCYKKKCEEYSITEFTLYVLYFPYILQGPIAHHSEMIKQFKDITIIKPNYDNFSIGLYNLSIGLSKKVIFADIFGRAVDVGFAQIGELDTISAIVVMLSYTFQIYFDFSGYCDMANGVSKMFNIDLPINFNSPYKAITINDFWDRWHITLTNFFTKYLYISIGGNRKGKFRTYINILTVFLVSGLWHGASWTYIIWGGLHGVFSVTTRICKKIINRISDKINWIITFIFINFSWLVFRADNMEQVGLFIENIFDFNFHIENFNVFACFNILEIDFIISNLPFVATFFDGHKNLQAVILCIILILVAFYINLCRKNVYEKVSNTKLKLIDSIYASFLMFWSVFSLTTASTFIYVGF